MVKVISDKELKNGDEMKKYWDEVSIRKYG